MTKRLPTKFAIRDTRNGDWAWVYRAVVSDPHLTANEVRVYASLACFDSNKHEIYPNYDTIAKKSNSSRRGVINAIKKLIKVEYVSVEYGGGRKVSNQYFLLKKPKGCKFCTVSKRVQKTTRKGAKNDTKRVQPVHPNNIDINKINKQDINTNGKLNKYRSIKSVGEEEFLEIAEYYGATPAFVRSKYDDMVNWHESTGKTRKNWKATLRNFVKKGAMDLRKETRDKSKITFINPK